MEFIVSREALLRPLQAVIGVVERRQTLPILANVLVEVDAGTLALTATDLEVELRAHTPVEVIEPGRITIPARKLMDIVRNLPDDAELKMALEGERIIVRAGRSRFSLAYLSADDFPLVNEVEANQRIRLPQHQVRWLIEKTHFAMAMQDVRYYLNGLLFELNGNGLKTVATDGHRLALAELAVDLPISEAVQIIVPRKAIQELLRLLDGTDVEVELALSSAHLQVSMPDLRFTTKLIDGRFPDYQRVIPAEEGSTVNVDREMLRKALVRASILSNEKYRGVRFIFEEEQLRIQSNNPEQEEAEEEVAAESTGGGMEIGFNASYMLDALGAIEAETITMYVRDGSSSALLVGDRDGNDGRYVVMPMRL